MMDLGPQKVREKFAEPHPSPTLPNGKSPGQWHVRTNRRTCNERANRLCKAGSDSGAQGRYAATGQLYVLGQALPRGLVCTNDQLAAVKIRNTVTQAPASTIQSMHQAYQTVQSVSRPRRRTGPAPDMDRSPEHSLAHRG